MVAIYARVSTEAQADNDNIQIQIDKALEWCTANNIVDYCIYKDDGISGGGEDLSERIALLQLLQDVKAKVIDTVWIFALDRLSRNVGTYAIVLNVFKKARIKLYIKNALLNLDNPTDTFLGNILAAVAEFEKENIKIRMALGMAKLKDAGLYAKPELFGYRKVGRDEKTKRVIIEPYEPELEVMKMVYEKLDEGKSLSWIFKNLLHTSDKTTWSQRVRYPEYAGYTPNSKGELILSSIYKPIIDFDKWQDIVNRYNDKASKVKSLMKTTLHFGTNILKCYYCGFGYYLTTHNKNKKKQGVIIGTRIHQYYKQIGLGYKIDCKKPFNQIEKAKFESMLDLVYLLHYANTDNFNAEVENQKNILANRSNDYKDILSTIDKQLDSENRKMKNLVNAIANGIALDSIKDEIKDIQVKIDELKIKKHNTEIESIGKLQNFMENCKDVVIKEIDTYLTTDDMDYKRNLLLRIIKKATIKDDVLCISTVNNKHYYFSRFGLPAAIKMILDTLKLNHKNLAFDSDFRMALYVGIERRPVKLSIQPIKDELEVDADLVCLSSFSNDYPFLGWNFVDDSDIRFENQ